MKFIKSKIILVFYLIYMSKSLQPNDEPVESEQEFRGVWVSPWGGDQSLIEFETQEEFIKRMTYILDTLKMYNMNAIIYHVRTHNDALYKSKINPVSPYFSKVDFDKFNPLKWMIEESHKRGIDFHAWMNPYRIKSTNKMSIDEIISKYKDYDNPANDKNCILNGTNTLIMDPGLEKVRNFIWETINEFLGQFDVDAIHFDDYFYCDMGAGGKTEGNVTILDEPDQNTYEEYIKNNPECNYDSKNAKDKANWRRDQVDLLIKMLHENINKYNIKNNKKVQFGISPTGIYKNGDGVVTYDKNNNAVTTGSETNGQEHYASYLFCDTLKWVNNGWINYILPQSYWAQDHPLAHYQKVIGWWNKVVEFKNVNLFSGIGLYMADLTGKTYGWKNNTNELYEDLIYVSQSKNIDGVSIYNFDTLRRLRDGKETMSATQVKNGMKAWKMRVPLPEIKSYEKIKLEKAQNLKFENKKLSFNKINGAKFYIVYKSKENILFKNEEIIDIFGSYDDVVTWEETEEGNFKYGIKGLSYSNTLGEGAILNSRDDSSSNSNHLSMGIISCILMMFFLLL